ncbi:SnoaL-like polyketide cyclase [Palleronia aestuarii]|uniref:SnoaL-like polyketide cyclase n=1 Tax=Palleronia aestuarii TaxID=568105 RepID=A0A2W7NKB8_9RHOB|nr:nuclear transport factor 2 family protein [Palleronia aestuarii]PZX13636.1 SnoaL-like polyketide cyclase [Palleronia aestuarii]
MRHEDILAEFYRTVWSEGDVASLGRYFSPDALTAGISPEFAFRIEDFQALVQAVLRLVDNVDVKLVRLVSEGEWLSALTEVSCTSRRTGAPVRLRGQSIMRFVDGKIVEAHNNFDTLDFFVQLGMLRPDFTVRLLVESDAA